MLQWLPTTGEFGLYGTFGDYDYHEKLATRLGVHYTHSTEDKQSQPGSDSIENTQIRLTDGSSIFTPDLFGPGITVERVNYQMSSVDGGLKYKGLSLEAEWYWRWLSDYKGLNTGGDSRHRATTATRCRRSAMVVPKAAPGLRRATRGSTATTATRGRCAAAPTSIRSQQRGFRVNTEWIHVDHSPVGYTAYPLPVGGNGDVIHLNLELNF